MIPSKWGTKPFFSCIFFFLFITGTTSTLQQLRETFERDFHSSCDSYQFVQRYISNIENPSNRHIVFVYHENGLKNGGLGDRLGGIVTAAANAIRFNRTLLIQSANGFENLFRPYYNAPSSSSTLSPSLTPTSPVFSRQGLESQLKKNYSYDYWTSWSGYNHSYQDRDETEYDLWDCINTRNSRKCGIEDGDVPQPIIKMRANRAYLCRWAKETDILEKELGVSKDDDLMQVAGCLLRLSMWPTERMWEEVGILLENLRKEAKNETGGVDFAGGEALDYTSENAIRIGVHFRCGDHSYIHPDAAARWCTHDDNEVKSETPHMKMGSPVDIGKCAREIYQNYSKLGQYQHPQRHRSLRHRYGRNLRSFSNSSHESFMTLTSTAKNSIDSETRALVDAKEKNFLLYVASDNPSSALQMVKYAKYPYSYVSPHGCHVQLDQSFECTMTTTAYWMILSLSDMIVTSTENNNPISAFSRFAAIYGLKKDILRNSLNCGYIYPRKEMSHHFQGNWFCS